MACQLAERDRIGGIAGKMLLIDIEAYADKAMADLSVREDILDQNATYLAVARVYVVWPLDTARLGIGLESVV